jgi:hypothetical protein
MSCARSCALRRESPLVSALRDISMINKNAAEFLDFIHRGDCIAFEHVEEFQDMGISTLTCSIINGRVFTV